MSLRPRLNVRCGRCGKPREGLRHVCRSNSTRRATIKLAPALGTCPRCGKDYGNPLTHVCRPKSDFRKRRTEFGRKVRARAAKQARQTRAERQRAQIAAVRERERERSRARAARLKASYEARLAAARAKAKQKAKPAAGRPRKPPHEYQSCADTDCMRPVCVAFKEGHQEGHREGYQQGFEQGWQRGYPAGYADGYGAGFTAGLAACPGPHNG